MPPNDAPDTAFPIFLSLPYVQGASYGPIDSFCGYVETLAERGAQEAQIPRIFRAIQALNYYKGQVDNGGHSQFVGNVGAELFSCLDLATEAAQVIGIETFERTLKATEEWCRANPKEAARQTGFDVRDPALNALDGLYHEPLDDAAVDALFADAPAETQDWLRHIRNTSDLGHLNQYLTLRPRSGHGALVDTPQRFVEREKQGLRAARRAAEIRYPDLCPILDRCLALCGVPTPEADIAALDARLNAVVSDHAIEAGTPSSGDWTLTEGYTMRCAAWILEQPGLTLLDKDWETHVHDFVASIPGAEAARLEAQNNALPSDAEIAYGRTLPPLNGERQRIGTMPTVEALQTEIAPQRIQNYGAETEYFVCRRGNEIRTLDAAPRPAWMQDLVRTFVLPFVRNKIQQLKLLGWLGEKRPGRVLGRATIDPRPRAAMVEGRLAQAAFRHLTKNARPGLRFGVLDSFDPETGHLAWIYSTFTPHEPTRIYRAEILPNGVRIEEPATGEASFYPKQALFAPGTMPAPQ